MSIDRPDGPCLPRTAWRACSTHYGTVSLLVSLFALSAAPSLAATNVPADVAAVRAAELAMANTVQIDRLVRFYATDAVLLDAFTPGLSLGRDEVRAEFLPQLEPLKNLSIDADDMTIVTEGDYACVMSQQRIAVTAKTGATMHTAFRLQNVWHRVGGTWLVLQEHVGYPVDMTTGMGAMDSPIIPMQPVSWTVDPFDGLAQDTPAMQADLQTWQSQRDRIRTAADAMRSFGPAEALRDIDTASPGVRTGWTAFDESLRQHAKATRSEDTVQRFHAVGDGRFAASYSVHEVLLHAADNAVIRIRYRQSDCLHRVDGHWYAFQEMRSFPLDIASRKAAMTPLRE